MRQAFPTLTAVAALLLAGAGLSPAQAPDARSAVSELVERHQATVKEVTETRALLESLDGAAVEAPGEIHEATIEVSIQGPTQVASGGFALIGSGEAGAVLRWRIQSPEGAAEPLRLRDESGAPVLAFFSPSPGRYMVTLTAQKPVDGLDPFGEASHTVIVGKGPGPQPEPEPDPEPQPDPVPGDGFRVVFLYESDALGSLPPSQAAIFTAVPIRTYLKSKTAEVNGTHEFRVWDDDYPADVMAHETAAWQAAYERAKADAAGRLPWVLILSDNAVLASEPLPLTVNDTLALLRKHGGN